MENDFDLVINDVVYRVETPPQERLSRVIQTRLAYFFLFAWVTQNKLS